MTVERLVLPEALRSLLRGRARGRRRLLWLTYEFQERTFDLRFGDLVQAGVSVDIVAGVPAAAEGAGGLRRGWRVWRARWPGTFHPKVVLVLADGRVTAGVGSANLTTAGLSSNVEAWRFFDEGEGREELRGLRRLLAGLLDEGVLSKRLGLEEFLEALPAPGGGVPPLAGSHEGPLLDWARRRLGRGFERLDVVSPLSGNPARIVDALRSAFGVRSVHLHTGPEGMRIPPIRGVDEVKVLPGGEKGDQDDGPEPIPPVVHAKLLAFRKGERVDLLWGSANLSEAAWRGKGRARNFEVVLHAVASRKEWEAFLKGAGGGAGWVKVDPVGDGTFPQVDRKAGGWALLQATWDGESLVLEASSADPPGEPLHLRRGPGWRAIPGPDRFPDGEATLPPAQGAALVLAEGTPPATLEWRRGGRPWARIPLNFIGGTGEDGRCLDALESLYLDFAGRPLPGPSPAAAAEPEPTPGEDEEEPPDKEEEELTSCAYHGALDRRVLEVRLVARRLAASCAGRAGLWEARRREALRRVDAEDRRRPDSWSPAERSFLEEELEKAWRG